MPIDFPNSPTTNQTFTSGSTTWKYDGSKWKVVTSPSNLSSATPDALTPDQTGAAGTSSDAARADHAHEILAATASTITGTNAEGTSTSFARADHNHEIQAVGAFSAYFSGSRSLASAGAYLDFDAEDFDVSGWHDSTTTKGQYKPQKAGYYLLGIWFAANALTAGTFYDILLRKNDSDHRRLMIIEQVGQSSYPQHLASIVVEANGTTDQFRIFAYHTSTSNRTLTTGSGLDGCRFWGHYLGRS